MEKRFIQLTFLLFNFIGIHGLSAQCSELFISEYLEGSSYNKAIEIYNPTVDSVDLADYELQLFSNGSNSASQIFTSSQTIPAYTTYVIAHNSADSSIKSKADTISSSLANFNGDDAIALINTVTGDTLDIFGVIGVDPGSGWSVTGTNSSSGTTANRTLVRDSSVQQGNKDWSVASSTEWMVFATDMSDSIGTHTANCPSSTAALATSITVDSTVSCNGGIDGGATVFANGGTAPYTYLWSNSDTDSSITGLAAGDYYSTVTDAANATIVDTVTITEPAALIATIVVDSNVSCNGMNNGGLNVTTSGGTAPYTYSWSNADTTASTAGIGAGSYSVTVTDANACSTSATDSIIEPATLTASIIIDSNVSCNGGNDGKLYVTGNGGILPYTYTWSNNASTDSLNNVIAGTYSATISDANGCSAVDTAHVSQPTILSISTSVVNHVSINGGNDGKAYVSTLGGTKPYSYNWSNAAQTDTIGSLIAGTYMVTVTDGNACSAIDSLIITEPPALISSIVVDSNVSCHGFQDGGLTANASGGVTPYIYLWSNSDTTASIDSLSGGLYSVTITDANGATVVDSGTVNEPAALSVTITVVNHESFNGAMDGKAYATASGGTAPYVYNWSIAVITDTINNLSAGNYQVTVSDANGCFVVDSVKLIVLSNHLPKLVITEIMYNAAESGTDTTEHIEILNADTAKVALNGFRFLNGITHTFGAEDSIAVGHYAIIAYDSSAFRNRYGFNADFIWTSGELSNSGELIVFADQFGRSIDSVDYDDAIPWPSGSNAGDPDGGGASIELTDSSSNNMLGQNWISSAAAIQGQIVNGFQVYGTPGSGPLPVSLNHVSAGELNNFSFFPNPNHGQLTIEVNANIARENSPIQIYDLSGKLVYESLLSSERKILHLNKLSNGVYFIRIQNDTKKLIITK